MARDSSPSAPKQAVTNAGSGRLLSLDVFRGITILAMILVNNPGQWGIQYQYWPVEHAEWHGWTPTDLIFPFFLFIVGTSLAYSLRKYRDGETIRPAVYWRIIRRTALLIFLGWFPQLLFKAIDSFHGETFDLSNLRIFGVLVRIALVYFFASLIMLHFPLRAQVVLAAFILLAYWATLAFLPNPHDYAANLSNENNVVNRIDRATIGKSHMYTYDVKTHQLREPTEPEGLLSTFPAIVTSLLGYWAGLFIQRRGTNRETVLLLLGCGAILLELGLLWHLSLPINKKIWTSSFVLLTGGLGVQALAVCVLAFDIAGYRRLARPFEIVGINAIFVYVASGLLDRCLTRWQIEGVTAKSWLYSHLFTSWISDPKLSSLSMALLTVAFWWFICWVMSRLGWSVRV